MSFVAEAERSLDVSPETAFDRLADHASWGDWMPTSFRPVGRSKGPLRRGDLLKVKVEGVPGVARLHVSVSRRPDPKDVTIVGEIAWTAGIFGLVWAEHRFLFEPKEGGTRVRSVETWRGPVAEWLKKPIMSKAARIGSEQLAGLARSLG